MGAAEGNTNAEKWDLESAQDIFRKAINLATDGKREEIDNGTNEFDVQVTTYDFIGEVARELGIYRDLFAYLVEKFPELKDDHKQLMTALEANCFSNGKKGNIVPSLAIMNLKSNHGWTDRVDNTSGGKPINTEPARS